MSQLISRRSYIQELSIKAQEVKKDLVAYTDKHNRLACEAFDCLPLHHSKGQAFAVVYAEPERYEIDGDVYEITHELIGCEAVD